ncbi:hypothetical protein [Streptomyces sp. NPDC048248]|uniref:hypothetical protein n=1 Tax=Streptomyces sp. NPDC048248 TaxID=3365523 RepID=UPI00371FEA4D
MTARRPLLTAAAAGSVLFALWFVPSANAIVGEDGVTHSRLRAAQQPAASEGADRAGAAAQQAGSRAAAARSATADAAVDTAPQHFLADTGSPDTTPYVIGGVACLALGAGLVSYSVQRARGVA